MNKEEIEKLLNKCDNCNLKECIACEFTYTEIQKIKNYLEQKESILDKVMYKIEELIEIAKEDKEQKKIIELPNGIKYEDKVISLDTFIIALDSVLNIIEGEKK